MGRREKAGEPSRLRALRRSHSDLSLAEFARTIGYSASYLSAVELQHLAATPEVLYAYETTLGLPPSSLTGERRTVPRVLGRALTPRGTPANAAPQTARPASGAVEASLSLLREAAERGPAHDTHMYLTCETDRDLFAGSEDLFTEWLQALRRCLRSGWSVVHLYRMNADRQRSLQMVEAMIDLLGSKGDYKAVFQPGVTAASPATDLLVVPGVGAAMLLSGAEDIAAAVVVRDQAQIAVLEEHCRGLAEACTPLIAPRSRKDRLRFERETLELDASVNGRQMIVMNSIPSLGYPVEFCKGDSNFVRRLKLTAEDAIEFERLHRQRAAILRERLQRHRYQSICPKQSMLEFLRTGNWPDDPPGLPPLSREDIRAVFSNLVSMLESYPTFEMALIDDTEVRWLRPKESDPLLTWMVRADQIANLECWPLDDDGNPSTVHVVMREPSIAGAFADYFVSVWDRIAPANKDRHEVIQWLQARIAEITVPEAALAS